MTKTIAAEDLTPTTRALLERGERITDAALAEIRAVASPLNGREGWEIDEDGESRYVPSSLSLDEIFDRGYEEGRREGEQQVLDRLLEYRHRRLTRQSAGARAAFDADFPEVAEMAARGLTA